MIKDNTLFFIHIPKTAGSSFRKAAESYFGIQNCFYDYGNKSSETHPKIFEYEYKQKDRFAAGEYIIQHARFLSGHVPYSKYAAFFHPKNVITFVRSPEQQVRSHFEHYVRHHGYKGDFEDFIADRRFANMQSRMLKGLGIDALGFVGLTEEYETSLALINALYKTDLKRLSLNKNQSKNEHSYTLSDKELKLIHEHNKEDFELYEQACQRFQKQKKAIEESQPFIRFGLLHLPPKQAQHKLNGWLTCYESNQAQELDIYINGEKVETVIANEYRGMTKERNMNRSGFIGFTYHYPKNIKPNDLIELFANANNELVYSMRYQDTPA